MIYKIASFIDLPNPSESTSSARSSMFHAAEVTMRHVELDRAASCVMLSGDEPYVIFILFSTRQNQ